MKYHLIYIVFVLIIKLLCWRQHCLQFISHWIHKLLWYCDKLIEYQQTRKMYAFRPYELIQINYKTYGSGSKGRGINMYPKARSGHRIVANDTDIFCFGGFNPDLPNNTSSRTSYLFQEMWKFNIMTQKWSKIFNTDIERMPEELASNAVIMKDDMMVVFGGTGFPFGRACSNKCYLFWPYAMPRQISLLETTGNAPEAQYGQAIMLRDKYLYVIGGTTGFEYSCDIFRLDLVSKVWECIHMCQSSNPDDPQGRYRHEIAYDDNHIYVFGGGTSEIAYNLETIPAFDLKQSKWISIKTKPDPKSGIYPEPRKCHSCIQYDTPDGIDIIIAGGYFEDQKFFKDIWKLNLRTYEWKKYHATMPKPLYFHDAATSGNGLMYIFGGISVGNDLMTSSRTNDVYKMWTTIPKLSEICWEAVVHYYPHISKLEKVELFQAGIPPKFAERAALGQRVALDF